MGRKRRKPSSKDAEKSMRVVTAAMELATKKTVCPAFVRSAMMKNLAFLQLRSCVLFVGQVSSRPKLVFSSAVVMSSTRTASLSFYNTVGAL